MPFVFLLDGSCAQNKVLKQELTKTEFQSLKSKPDCVKEHLLDVYNDNGSIDNISLSESTIEGKVYYAVVNENNGAKFFTNSCEEVSDYPEQFNANAFQVFGKQLPLEPKPFNGESIEMASGTKPSKVGTKRPQAELDPMPGKPKRGNSNKLSKYDSQAIENAKSSGMSDCIQDKIAYFITDGTKLSLAKCYSYTSNGETFYMFDHGMAVDGPGYVLNESCDTVCVAGGMRLNPDKKPCPREDSSSQRKDIWLKGELELAFSLFY